MLPQSEWKALSKHQFLRYSRTDSEHRWQAAEEKTGSNETHSSKGSSKLLLLSFKDIASQAQITPERLLSTFLRSGFELASNLEFAGEHFSIQDSSPMAGTVFK